MKIQSINVARVAIVIVLVALLRTISEILRLAYIQGVPPDWTVIKAYLIGSTLWVIGGMVMIIAYFMGKYKSVSTIGIITIAGLIFYKLFYLK